MKEINRRIFLTQTIGAVAGVSLFAFPSGRTGLWAAQETPLGEGIAQELDAKVDRFMPIYMTCSQTSLAALNEQFGLKADGAIPGLMPFAGGLAGKGETCGAVSGSMLAIGFFLDSMIRNGKVQPVSALQYARSFLDGFEREFGSTRCREVVKKQFGRYFDLQNPDDQKAFMAASQKDSKCIEVIKEAVYIAGAIIAKG
jgi:C_GCAxxG_C_C family probable redox protein